MASSSSVEHVEADSFPGKTSEQDAAATCSNSSVAESSTAGKKRKNPKLKNSKQPGKNKKANQKQATSVVESDSDSDEEIQSVTEQNFTYFWMKLSMDLRSDSFMYTTFQRSLESLLKREMTAILLDKRAEFLRLANDKISTLSSSRPKSRRPSKEQQKRAKTNLAINLPILQDRGDFIFSIDDDDSEMEPGEDLNKCEQLANYRKFGYPLYSVRIENEEMKACWEAQFLTQVDQVKKMLYINLHRFNPQFSEKEKKIAKAGKSLQFMTLLQKNASKFQVSRELRMAVPLNSISALYYLPKTADEDSCASIVVLDLKESPQFFTRRMNCRAMLKNDWRKRTDFTPNQAASSLSRIFLTGDEEYLGILVAMMAAADVSVKKALDKAVRSPLSAVPAPFKPVENDDSSGPSTSGTSASGTSASGQSTSGIHMSKKVSSRRQAILNVLIKTGLISHEEAQTTYREPQDRSEGSECRVNNFIGSLPHDNCFSDYVNFHCKDAKELERILNTDVHSDCCECFPEEQDEEDDNEDESEEIVDKNQDRTVLSFLKKGSCGECYFSFCQQEMLESMHDSHCSLCHECNDWHFWHCFNCNRCSYGQSISTCEWCGSRDDEPPRKVRPMNLWGRFDGSDKSSDDEEQNDSDAASASGDEAPEWKEPPVPTENELRFGKLEFLKHQFPGLMSGLLGRESSTESGECSIQ